MKVTLNPQPSTVTSGTWDSARHWLNYAGQFERCKLYCQVMLGFELVALKKQRGVTHGNNQHTGRTDQNDLSTWDEIVERELGLKHGNSIRFEAMAKAAAPRLKKFPGLKDFDPITKPIDQLPAPQKAALEKGLHKMTDGQTQKEFGEQLGLWKKPQGSGALGRKPGEGGRKKLSLQQQAELLKAAAADDWQQIDNRLSVYKDKFTCLTDTDVVAQIAMLDKALKARNEWLKQPANKRNPKTIEQLFI